MFWSAHVFRIRQHTRRPTRWTHARTRNARFEQLEQKRVLTVSFDSGSGLLTVNGTSGNDTILIAPTSNGINAQVTLNGQIISNSIPPVAISSINQIQVFGSDGNDLVTIKSIDKPVTVDGGTGTNELSIIGHAGINTFVLDTSSVQVNGFAYTPVGTSIQLLNIAGQNANDIFTVNNFSVIPTVIDGSGGVNTLQGPNVDTTWNIQVTNGGNLNSTFHFGNIQNLTGGTGDDTFLLTPGKSVSSTISGGAGNDTISFAASTTPVSVNLQTHSATGVGRFSTDIENIIGGAANDTLTGPNTLISSPLPNTWNITGANAITFDGVGFTSFENLTGGTVADDFVFADGATVSGKIDGGAGSNTLDYSAYTTSLNVVASNFARIQSVVGSTMTGVNVDFIGPNANNTWNITGTNAGNVGGISFTNVDTITGSTKNDTFLFAKTGLGDITGTIDGGPGTNVLNYSLLTTPITIDLTANSATGAGGIANITGVIGGSSTSTIDTVIGPTPAAGAQNTWTITGNNAGNINGTFTFSGIENLTGGPMDDTFVIPNGKKFSGHIDGGDTTNFNTLDYSAYTTAINVNLTTGTATNIAGGVSNMTDILGGSGNDVLTGNTNGNLIWGNGGNDIINGMGGNDILVGGNGNDTITGGSGRDLIMGGAGRDILNGEGGEDILISGTTSFDTDGATQNAILNFWILDSITTTDSMGNTTTTQLPFATRVAELRAGTTGVTTIPTFDSTNIFDDTSSDTLTGGSVVTPTDDNLDWFFATLSGSNQDTITDFSSGEAFN
ncbi:MAG TPA: calcium-binding protein [Pirellulales bacterium]|nr:calcium-binding protein [Pirellulales bacterium]